MLLLRKKTVFLVETNLNERKMVKTIVLGQDLPFYKKTGGMLTCMYPLPPP